MMTLKNLLLYLFIILILCDSAYSQQAEIPIYNPTLEDKVISEPSLRRHGQYITLNFENDLIGDGEDENYTNGTRISYHNADITLPSWARGLGEIYPGFRLNDTTALTYSIGQNLYTPRDITTSIPDKNDRPYAGWLYGSIGLSTITDNHQDTVELSLGVVGPASLGKVTQNFIHNHVSSESDDPQGWNSQLKNEIGGVISWEREYPDLINYNLGNKLYLSFAPSLGLSAGNIHTLGQTGLNFRLAPTHNVYPDLPSRVRPSASGTGYFPKLENKFSWGIFGGVTGYAVGHNIFLDGNTFTDSPSVDKEDFVYDTNIGLDIIYSSTRLSYTLTNRSKEFKTQTNSSTFGSISLTRRF